MDERRIIVVEMVTEKLHFREISKMIVFQVHKRGYFSAPRLRKVQWALRNKGTMKNIILERGKMTIWRFPENATFQSPFPRQFFSRSLYTNPLGFRGGQTPKKRSFKAASHGRADPLYSPGQHHLQTYKNNCRPIKFYVKI